MKAKKQGRPKVKDRTKSYSVSLKPTEKKKITDKHCTLTAAIKTLL